MKRSNFLATSSQSEIDGKNFLFPFYSSVLFLHLLWFLSRTKRPYASVKCFLAELCPQFNQNAFGLNKIIDPCSSAACAAGTTCWPSRPSCQILTHSQLSSLLSESHGLLLSLPQRLTQDAARHAAAHTLAQSARPLKSARSFYGNGKKCHIHYKKNNLVFFFKKKTCVQVGKQSKQINHHHHHKTSW